MDYQNSIWKNYEKNFRKIAEGDNENLGDTSTLLDPTVVEKIKISAQ